MKSLFTILLILVGLFVQAQELPQLIPYRKGNLWGYTDQERNVKILPEYDEVSFFDDATAKVKKNDLYGLIDTTGKQLTPVKYTQILPFSEGMARFTEGQRQGYLDTLGQEAIVLPEKYSFSLKFSDYDFKDGLALIIYKKPIENSASANSNQNISYTNMYGYINKKGEVVIEPQFTAAGAFTSGIALVTKNNEGKSQLINKKGEALLNPDYFYYEEYILSGKTFYGLIKCKPVISKTGETKYKNCKLGLFDENLNEVIKPKFSKIAKLTDSLIVVTDRYVRSGLINAFVGKKATPRRFDEFYLGNDFPVIEAMALGKMSLLDLNGNYILTPEKKNRDYYQSSDRNFSYQSKSILSTNSPFHYPEKIEELKWYVARSGKKVNIYLPRHQVLISKKCENIEPLTDSLLLVSSYVNNPVERQEGQKYYQHEVLQYVIIDLHGNEIVPTRFGNYTIEGNIIKHIQDTTITIFTKQGEHIITTAYKPFFKRDLPAKAVLEKTTLSEKEIDVYNFTSCYKITESLGNTGFIVQNRCAPTQLAAGISDKSGKLLIPFRYQNIIKINDSLVAVQLLGKWGVLQPGTGKIIIPVEYESVMIYSEGLFLLTQKPAKRLYERFATTFVFNGQAELVHEFRNEENVQLKDDFLFSENDYIYVKPQLYRIRKDGVLISGKAPVPVEGVTGIYKAETAGSWGVIDYEGNIVVPFKFTDPDTLKMHVVNTTKLNCNLSLPPERFSGKLIFSEGKAWVRKRGIYYIYKKDGSLIETEHYFRVNPFSEGLAHVISYDFKHGYLDENGEVQIPHQFDGASDFKNGYAIITMNNQKGLIDKTGKLILPARYYDILISDKGKIYARKNDTWYSINKNGAVTDSSNVRPIKVNQHQDQTPTTYLFKSDKNTKYGANSKLFYHKNNTETLLFKNIENFEELPCGLIAVQLANAWHYSDAEGNAFYEEDFSQHMVK